ncbi:MAG: F0F1 ATP synthase subunit B [Oscillospiraceae bacterium]|nr:F0F1 ATP synthase subunit B [Oscillospiraceae bacterium]
MGFSPIVGFNLSTVFITFVNTMILLFLYWKFLHVKVIVILEKRKEMISEELTAAEQAKLSAQQKEQEYTTLLAESKAEAEKIITSATVRAHEKERDILSEANENAANILKKAEDNIELEKKRVTNEIKNQISELVILTASAVAEKEINEDDNKTLIESFLVNV